MENPQDGFDVYWAFKEGCKPIGFCEKYSIIGTLKYIWILNTSEYLITNHRTQPRAMYWRKKKNQKYIMTWHGSMPLKKIEKDALGTLSPNYEKIAKFDSSLCDLMISDSAWYTTLLRRSFWFDGQILECGMPRNDMFFNKKHIVSVRMKVQSAYNIPSDSKIVLYAPTFRQDKNTTPYIYEWGRIIHEFSQKTCNNVFILIKLHPWLKGLVSYKKCELNQVIDVTLYDDIQELLTASDILITDFSSTMFEFALQKKPCFLAAKDLNNYERGTYFELESLPFKRALNENELCEIIQSVDLCTYVENQFNYIEKTFNPIISHISSKEIVKWMNKNSIVYGK